MTPDTAKLPVSAFIITRDEEDRIEDAILSVSGWVDEVIVVDSGSTDKTIEIAKNLGARVFENQWSGYGPQKRFAEEKCNNPWLFNLDADERVTPELASEIRNLFLEDVPEKNYYIIPIADVFPHEEKPAPWAYSYMQIRLYDSRISRFSNSPVHDTVRPPSDATSGKLRSKMAHRSQVSIAFFVEKMNRYSSMQIEDLQARGKKIPRYRLITEMPLSFLKAYFLRRHCLYGWWGLVSATTFAFSRYLRVAKAYEKQLLNSKK